MTDAIELVAGAIAREMDIDPDVFIGMHSRHKWEKQWHPIAEAAIEAMPSQADEVERLMSVLTYIAETSDDEHSSRKAFAALQGRRIVTVGAVIVLAVWAAGHVIAYTLATDQRDRGKR